MIATAAVAIDGPSSLAQKAAPGAASAAAATASQSANPAEYTAGIGVYPGDPRENFDPILVPDDSGTYRNLALLRPAYHSSSYDYNLTAQLVTDGIKDTDLPRWIVVSEGTNGLLAKTDREVVVDHAPMNTLEIKSARAQVDIEIAGGTSAPEIDRIQLFVVSPNQASARVLKFTVSTSDDGRTWQETGSVSSPAPASTAGYPPDFCAPNHFFTPFVPLNAVSRSRFYRVECSMGSDAGPEGMFETTWRVGQIAFFHGDTRVEIGGPYSFTSAWMSEGSGEEWVYVDLGARFEFDRVKLYWIARATEGSVQVSDDAESWHDLQALSASAENTDDFKLSQSATGRYVRVLMKRPSSEHGYILSEIERSLAAAALQRSPSPRRRLPRTIACSLPVGHGGFSAPIS